MEKFKKLLTRESWDSKNAMTITTHCEHDNDLLLETTFINFSRKQKNTTSIAMQVKVFDVRVLVGIIRQVVGAIRVLREKNIKISNQNTAIEEHNNDFPEDKKALKEKKKLEYTSQDTIQTSKSNNISDLKTIKVAFKNDTLYINALHGNEQITLGFKKIEIEPLIDSLSCYCDSASKSFYQYISSFDR